MNQHVPENAEVTRELVRERVKATRSSQQMQASIEVTWRSGVQLLPVISMPLSALLYNPETHRIRAQRDYNATSDAAIDKSPWGTVAQDYLGSLLSALPIDPSREDPAFAKLQEDLALYGQKEPGIVTPEGILINGNTRCAALRASGASDMKVAVLPEDWSWDDAALVELDLQMRKDHRRDYSFVNLLLALDESVNMVGADGTSKSFRIPKPTLERNLWILYVLRDLSERSRVDGTSAVLNLRDFESDQGKLEELHRTYNKFYKEDPSAANELKESRVLALLLDKSKTDLRLIGDNFATDYLNKVLPKKWIPAAEGPTKVDIPGLGASIETPTSVRPDSSQLVTRAAQARARRASSNDEEREEATSFLKTLDDAVDKAIDSAGRGERLKKKKTAAADKLVSAADLLDASIGDLAEAKSKGALDEDSLNDALVVLQEALLKLGRSVQRHITSDGEGFTWLEQNLGKHDR